MSRLTRIRNTAGDVVDLIKLAPDAIRAVRSVVELVMRPTPKPIAFARSHLWLTELDDDPVRCAYCGAARSELNLGGPCAGPPIAQHR